MKNLIAVALTAVLSGGITGCVIHGHGPAVVIPAGHGHDAHCGHFFRGGRWFHVRGHAHGPRCGHVFVKGVWAWKD